MIAVSQEQANIYWLLLPKSPTASNCLKHIFKRVRHSGKAHVVAVLPVHSKSADGRFREQLPELPHAESIK